MASLIAFDLDGTLIDSRRDLAGAVNYMRQSMNLEPLDHERIIRMVGNGINSLVRRAVADADVDFDTALRRMKRFYADHLLESTTLYDGVKNTLYQTSINNISFLFGKSNQKCALKPKK